MKSCCLQAGGKLFASNYPFEGPIEQDSFAAYVIKLCKKWGSVTSLFAENVYVRSTSSLGLGVNAKSGSFKCDTCGDIVAYSFIGARLFYFIWRVNMICATPWRMQGEPERGRLNMAPELVDWPREEHLKQLRIAFDMYFGKAPFLGTEGLAELNRQIFELTPGPALVYLYIVDFAELFVLFHEFQHLLPMSRAPEPQGVKVELPSDLEISPERANWWIAELNHDANSLYVLLISATEVFHEKFGMTIEDARTQAASLVCAGADAALHAIQTLEEVTHGKIDLKIAATSPNSFKEHPPADFRRNALSLASFRLLTGKSAESLYRREFTESWKTVAENVVSHMQVRDHLFKSYSEWLGA